MAQNRPPPPSQNKKRSYPTDFESQVVTTNSFFNSTPSPTFFSTSGSSNANPSQNSLDSYFYKKPKKKEKTLPQKTALSISSVVKAPSSSALEPKKDVLSQLTLNFGQKGQTPHHCRECGMHYFAHSKEDRIFHDKYHHSFTHLPYQTLKNEKVLHQTEVYKVVCIDHEAPPSVQEQAKSICDFVHRQLNAVSMDWSCHTHSLLLYITRHYVTGILLVQLQVSQVYPCTNPTEYDPEKAIVLPKPILGIDRVWVAQPRQGIGTLLVRLAQKEYQSESIAFSQPTKAGWKFAKTILKDSPVYIYL